MSAITPLDPTVPLLEVGTPPPSPRDLPFDGRPGAHAYSCRPLKRVKDGCLRLIRRSKVVRHGKPQKDLPIRHDGVGQRSESPVFDRSRLVFPSSIDACRMAPRPTDNHRRFLHRNGNRQDVRFCRNEHIVNPTRSTSFS